VRAGHRFARCRKPCRRSTPTTARSSSSHRIPAVSFILAEEDRLRFDLLSDESGRLSRLFGLAYQPPEPVAVWFDLLGLAGDEPASHLPLPGTYVVDMDGIAAYAFLEPDPTLRVDPRAVIDSLSRLRLSSAV
jgi:peroxiredoxin